MSNTDGAAGNEGSPLNPPPPRTEESPRRRSGGDNATPHGSPRGRGSSPRPPRPSPGSSRSPTGGGGGSGVGALRNAGSPAGRKRGRYGGAAADGAAGGGNQPGEGGHRNYHCSVCNKEFQTPHAVFGHMRAHPDRGWTGAHPPPAFRAEEEFADLRGGEAAEEEAGEGRHYRVPDLNNPPPPDSI